MSHKKPRAIKKSETEITISESGGIRYLHFGSPWIQGAMQIKQPNRLVLEYTRQMMAWLLFLEPPSSIVQLGLGAASLTKYVLAYCPRTHVQVVEVESSVVQAAHALFRLPHSHPRLEVDVADAQDWIQAPARRHCAQILQVDVYDTDALGPTCASPAFYAACAALLQEPGICVVNLFGRHASYASNRQMIDDAFDGRVLELPEIDEGNRVVLALKGPALEVSWERLFERAEGLEMHYELPARKWAKSIRGAYPTMQAGLRL